jgi:hypothetical protein
LKPIPSLRRKLRVSSMQPIIDWKMVAEYAELYSKDAVSKGWNLHVDTNLIRFN